MKKLRFWFALILGKLICKAVDLIDKERGTNIAGIYACKISHHEAILRLIEISAKNAHANGAWIGICGELAADTTLTETFLRMGIDELSVSPTFVLKLRDTIRNIDLGKVEI